MSGEMPEMPEIQVRITTPVSIGEVVSRYRMPDDVRAALLMDLLAREDEMTEAMQMFATVYGMYPQIIAYCLTALGFGSPPTPERRQMVINQYRRLMEEQPWRNQGDDTN